MTPTFELLRPQDSRRESFLVGRKSSAYNSREWLLGGGPSHPMVPVSNYVLTHASIELELACKMNGRRSTL